MSTHPDDPRSSPTGLTQLQQALAVNDPLRRRRQVWDLMNTLAKPMVQSTAYTVIPNLLHPRDDITTTGLAEIERTRYGTAEETWWGLQRGLAHSPHTLTALAAGTPSPVHGNERDRLIGAIRRPLTSVGYHLGPGEARTTVYALIRELGRVLNEPTPAPRPAPYPTIHPDPWARAPRHVTAIIIEHADVEDPATDQGHSTAA